MKKKFVIILLTALFVVLSTLISNNLITYADNEKTDVQTIETKRIDDNNVWNNLHLTCSDKVADFDSFIVNFDVSGEGKIAVALNNSKIILFDHDKPVCTIEFSSLGSYYVFWNDSNVCLYLARGDYIVEFTQQGKLVQICAIVDSSDTSDFVHNIKRTHSRSFDNYTYTAEKGYGLFNVFVFEDEYTTLEKVDVNANAKTTLYNCGSSMILVILFRIIIAIAFIGAILFMVIFVIVSLVKASRKNSEISV